MKKTVTIVAVLLVVVLACTTLVGCNQKPDENTLTIKAVNMGYGVQWLKDLADAYTAKHPEITVDVQSLVGSAGNDAIVGESESLAGYTDIFAFRPSKYHFNAYQGAVNTKNGKIDCIYADLTDIYTEPYEDGSTILSKMDSSIANYLKVDGKYYGVNWADGFMGIVRNRKVWNDLGLTDADIPVTTDEMFALCDKILAKNTGVAPFFYSKNEEYYTSIWSVWMAQYEGAEGMANWNNGLDPLGSFSEGLYSYEGLKVSLEIIQKLLSKKTEGKNQKYIYQHQYSDSYDFTTMQSHFLNNEAVFCVNGSWLEIEMNKNSNKQAYDIDFIKTPVTSAALETLPDKSVTTDAQLAEVIRYVDAIDEGKQATKPTYVTEADLARITEARHYAYVRSGADHTMVVAGWSEKIALAKDFIRFMYSDEGMKVYYKAQGGLTLPAKLSSESYDNVEMTTFTKSVNNAMKSGFYSEMFVPGSAKIYCLGGVSNVFVNGGGNFVNALLEGQSPDDIINYNKLYLKNNWTKISNACK